MRVALVHDWLITMGGAEQVLEALARKFPEAPIYTGVVNRRNLSPFLQQRTIIPTFVQSWPRALSWYNRYLLLLAYGFEQFDLSEFDLVISSSAAVAKGVVTRGETRHLSYVHTPMRYAWDLYHAYLRREARGVSRLFMGPVFHYLRLWDRLAADRVDLLVANSRTVQRRIAKHYGRDARVVYPPVAVDEFSPDTRPGKHFLVLSRLVAYKRFDLAVEACTRLGVPLVVAGDGPERRRLKTMAGPTVRFVGRVGPEQRRQLMQEAVALLFPGEEDFGIVAVEAQAAGRPVIAYGRGGLLDSVIDGKTGVVFGEQSVDELMEAIAQVGRIPWDPKDFQDNVKRFRPEIFEREMDRAIADCLNGRRNG